MLYRQNQKIQALKNSSVNSSDTFEERDDLEDLFWDRNLDIDERKVYFFEDVTAESSLHIIKCLAFLDKSPGDIFLIINSDGGTIQDGWAMVDFIRSMKNPVHGIVMGSASSMASVVLQACKTRSMARHAIMLVHSGSAELDGDINSITSNAAYLQKDMENTMDFYRSRAKISPKKMKEIMSKDTIFDAEEALKLGLIDCII